VSITSLNFDLAVMMGAEADETRPAVRVGRGGRSDVGKQIQFNSSAACFVVYASEFTLGAHYQNES